MIQETGVPLLSQVLRRQTFDDLATPIHKMFQIWTYTIPIQDYEIGTMLAANIWLMELVKAGFDLDCFNEAGETPLHSIISEFPNKVRFSRWTNLEQLDNLLSWVLILLLSGADASACDSYGRNALHHILLASNELCSFGSQSSERIRNWHLVLDFLCEGMRILCQLGSDILAVDRESLSPFDYARELGFESCWESVLWTCGIDQDQKQAKASSRSHATSFERHDTSGLQRRNVQHDKIPYPNPASDSCQLSMNADAHGEKGEPCPFPLPNSMVAYNHRHCPESCPSRSGTSSGSTGRQSLVRFYLERTGRRRYE